MAFMPHDFESCVSTVPPPSLILDLYCIIDTNVFKEYSKNMAKSIKSKVASEDFVYRVVFDSEKRLEKRFDKAEQLAEKRFSRLMEQMDSLAGQFKKFEVERELMSDKIREHSDQIEDLQKIVYAN